MHYHACRHTTSLVYLMPPPKTPKDLLQPHMEHEGHVRNHHTMPLCSSIPFTTAQRHWAGMCLTRAGLTARCRLKGPHGRTDSNCKPYGEIVFLGSRPPFLTPAGHRATAPPHLAPPALPRPHSSGTRPGLAGPFPHYRAAATPPSPTTLPGGSFTSPLAARSSVMSSSESSRGTQPDKPRSDSARRESYCGHLPHMDWGGGGGQGEEGGGRSVEAGRRWRGLRRGHHFGTHARMLATEGAGLGQTKRYPQALARGSMKR